MNLRGVALAIGLGLLLLPSGQAGSFASLQASEARVASGHLDGELEGAVWFAGGTSPPVAVDGRSRVDLPGLAISASRASVTIYHSDRYAVAEGAAIEPTTWSLSNVTATGAQADALDGRLIALPVSPGAARLGVDAPVLRVLPGPPGFQLHHPFVDGGPSARIETGESLLVVQGGEGQLRITGTVRLVVDGLDLVLSSDAGAQTLHTRRDVEGAEVQVMRSTYAAHSTVHEAVLDLEDAVVVFPAAHAYVRSAIAEADGHWSFYHATGVVGGRRDVSDETVAVDGDLEAVMERGRTGLFSVAVSGAPTQVSIDGRPLAVAEASQTGAGTVLAWTFLGIVLLSTAHLGSGRSRFRRLDHAMDHEQYDRALRLSSGFRGHPFLAQDATLAAAICLLALDRPAEAGDRLAERRRWTVRRRPTRDFLLARAEAAQGRRDAAARSLARSLVAEPSLLVAAQSDALLDAILRASRPPPPQEAYA